MAKKYIELYNITLLLFFWNTNNSNAVKRLKKNQVTLETKIDTYVWKISLFIFIYLLFFFEYNCFLI